MQNRKSGRKKLNNKKPTASVASVIKYCGREYGSVNRNKKYNTSSGNEVPVRRNGCDNIK